MKPIEALEVIRGILQEELIFHEDRDELLKPIENALKEYEILKKCLYVGKSGAIAITSYGFDNHDLLEEILK